MTILLRGVISVLEKLILIEKNAISKCADCFMEITKVRWCHKWGYNHDGHDTSSEGYDDYLVQEEEYMLDFLKHSFYLQEIWQ